MKEAAQVKTEIEKSREEKNRKGTQKDNTKSRESKKIQTSAGQETGRSPQEKEKPEISKEDILVDELLGIPAKKEETKQKNAPFLQRTDSSRLSGTISEKQGRAAGGTSKPYMPVTQKKPSVREELKEIKTGRKKKNHVPRHKEPEKNKGRRKKTEPRHKQPKAKRKLDKQRER